MKEFFNFERNVVNGLEVYSQIIPDLGWTAMELLVKGGARFDPPSKEGCAHLLEHMLSESGTRNFPSMEALKEFEEARELNVGWGATCLDGVRFSATGKDERFQDMLYLLFQLVFCPLLNHRLEHEKTSVKQEINKTPLLARLVQRRADKLLFGEHPLARFAQSTAGTLTTLAKISWQDLREHWQNFYRLGNCCLLVIGSLPGQFLEVIEKLLSFEVVKGITSPSAQPLFDFPAPLKNFMTYKPGASFWQESIANGYN